MRVIARKNTICKKRGVCCYGVEAIRCIDPYLMGSTLSNTKWEIDKKNDCLQKLQVLYAFDEMFLSIRFEGSKDTSIHRPCYTNLLILLNILQETEI